MSDYSSSERRLKPQASHTKKWEIRDGVPVLDEHALYDESGNLLIEIDEPKLKRIAANMNKRIQETGDEVPLVIGHTKDGRPENQQPEIVGFASKFRVAPLFRTGRKALVACFKYFRNKADCIAKYPRRSVELWVKKWEVDPISLLGASTPERNLGLLKFERADGLHYSRAMSEGSSMNPDEIVQKVIAALEQSDVFQFVRQLMEQSQQQDQSAPQPGMEDGQMPEEPIAGDDGVDGQVDGGPMDGNRGFPPEQQGDEEDGSERYSASLYLGNKGSQVTWNPQYREGHPKMSASAGVPSGSNTFVPSGTNMRREQYTARDQGLNPNPQCMDGPVYNGRPHGQGIDNQPVVNQLNPRLESGGPVYRQRTGSPLRESASEVRRLQSEVVRYQRGYNQLQNTVNDLVIRLQRSERRNDLQFLQDKEGIEMDIEEELDELQGLTDEAYLQRIDKLRKRYQRSPISDHDVYRYSRSEESGPQSVTKEQMQAAIALSTNSNGSIPYEAALNQVLQGDTRVF